MYCRNCGQVVNRNADICIHCGFRPLLRESYCQECGAPTKEGQAVCTACGVLLRKGLRYGLEELPVYYQTEFEKIRASGERYKGQWNWMAFLFGPFWGFYKGIILVSCLYILLNFILQPLFMFVTAIIYGWRGTYMYYVKQVKGKRTMGFGGEF